MLRSQRKTIIDFSTRIRENWRRPLEIRDIKNEKKDTFGQY
jgi:hypothetical protein